MQNQSISLFSEEVQKQIAETVISIVTKTANETLQKPAKRYYKKKEFCQEVGIANNTLTLWINRGLKVSQIEGISLIDMNDAIKFINEHKK